MNSQFRDLVRMLCGDVVGLRVIVLEIVKFPGVSNGIPVFSLLAMFRHP